MGAVAFRRPRNQRIGCFAIFVKEKSCAERPLRTAQSRSKLAYERPNAGKVLTTQLKNKGLPATL